MNPRIFASIVLLGYDYLPTFNMPFIISAVLCASWLITRAMGGLPAQKKTLKFV